MNSDNSRRSLFLLIRGTARVGALLFLAGVGCAISIGQGAELRKSAPLLELEYRIVGSQLRVSPEMVSVPKGVPGSVAVELVSGGEVVPAGAGTHIEATLRGPAFPARKLVGPPNKPLLLPSLNLVGDYQLDNIRMVESATGDTLMEGVPGSVPVHVFDEVLVSRVESRPLSLDEIKEKGIFIDELNFRAVEFDVTLVLRGSTFRVNLPVVAPSFHNPTEIIPAAELEERLAEAERINEELSRSIELPPDLETANLNLQIKGVNFETGGLDDDVKLEGPPPITGVLVIPGNIGYLNQFFSVQLFTENSAPDGSGLSVVDVQAQMILPGGRDQVPGTFEQPGDDPLRFARVGPSKEIYNVLPVVLPGADGELGTADDVERLHPGETGQAEFLVEGLQEGLHVMDLELTAQLEGLAAGSVSVRGRAAGSVLVRNPRFSLAFSHPRTVRFGEPYEAHVTLLNTGETVANLVSVSLNENSLSGVVFEGDQEGTIELGNLAPGESATATFHLRSQRTGYVSFSNLTTSEESVQGSLRLSMGVDERGVTLSSDSIGMPEFAYELPGSLLNAAQRVLGQALSVATAGRLPANVVALPKSVVTQRVVELAEAGQRIRYGDDPRRVYTDILLDWQGGRRASEGFDQIIRETEAGREWRDALMGVIESLDSVDGWSRMMARAEDIAGRGEEWLLASTDSPGLTLTLSGRGMTANVQRSEVPTAAVYRGNLGDWLVSGPKETGVIRWTVEQSTANASFGLFVVGDDGLAEQLSWFIGSSPAGAVYSYDLGTSSGELAVDIDGDGLSEDSFVADVEPVSELPPEVIAVRQDVTVINGRPILHCYGAYENYGTILAVLFSKPMRQEDIAFPPAFRLSDGNGANSVRAQPGGRVALVNLRKGVGTIRQRVMTISDLRDARGNMMATTNRPILHFAGEGTALNGKVIGLSGSPVSGVPVTLTMHDWLATPLGCVPVIVKASQEFTDENGEFTFDYIMAGLSYTISVTDTSVLTDEATDEIIQALIDARPNDQFNREKLESLANQTESRDALLKSFAAGDINTAVAKAEGLDRAVFRDSVRIGSARIGSEVPIVLRFRGRGTVAGRILDASGAPVFGAAVNLFPDSDSRELGRGMFTDPEGRFAFYGVPLGNYSICASTADGRMAAAVGFLEHVNQENYDEIALPDEVVEVVSARGQVFEHDGVTPHANAAVFIGQQKDLSLNQVVAAVTADSDGFWMADGIPAGEWDVVAVSADNRLRAERSDVLLGSNRSNFVTLQLQGIAEVSGQVIFDNGSSVSNAQVAGGEVLVTTDENGLFHLTGVPTGSRTIRAGLGRDESRGILVTRLGSAGVEVLPGLEHFVTIRLEARGRLTGRVFDPGGNPVPDIRVAIPSGQGFAWVRADRNGRYSFDNMALGDYVLSAPSPPVKDDPEEIAQQTIDAIRSAGSQDEILAAVTDGITAIVQNRNDGFSQESFVPQTWGFARTGLLFDGHVVNADIVMLPSANVGGVVKNAQGVPIGAEVILKGFGPLKNGAPGVVVRGGTQSDPEDGSFVFEGSSLVGPHSLLASSPIVAGFPMADGVTSPENPDSLNNVLVFPPQTESSGRLTGNVLLPDGSSAGDGVLVHISFAEDYVIMTDEDGFFDTQIKLPAGSYRVEATDPKSGLLGDSSIRVQAGIVNHATVTLLDKGALRVTVRHADGMPASQAVLGIEQGRFPGEEFEDLLTDDNGQVLLENVFQGPYSVHARQLVGATVVEGRGGAMVVPGETTEIEVVLAGSGSVQGQFVENDLATPVQFAQVSIFTGRGTAIGFATTDIDGRFAIHGVPLGTISLQAINAVTGRLGEGATELFFDGQVAEVVISERDLGEVQGTLYAGDGVTPTIGSEVTLNTSAVLSPARQVTTDLDGRFRFPATPVGRFSLSARDEDLGLSASFSGELPEDTPLIEVDLFFPPLASLAGVILHPDGSPAGSTRVEIRAGKFGATADTDEEGRFMFGNLKLGTYTVRAESLLPFETRSAMVDQVSITSGGAASEFEGFLSGVGVVEGHVFESDGVSDSVGARVTLLSQSQFFPGMRLETFTDDEGRYHFENVPLGDYDLTGSRIGLVARESGSLVSAGQLDEVDLVLSPSGSVVGRLFRADQQNVVRNVDIFMRFPSQSQNVGRDQTPTDFDGRFMFEDIPVGPFTLNAIVPDANGIMIVGGEVTGNGQIVDVGDLVLDEDDPMVIDVMPENTEIDVPIFATPELIFNESLAPSSVASQGIYLRSPIENVASEVELLGHPDDGALRVVRITPDGPLLSETDYEIVVINGERRNPVGEIIGAGPTDLVGRPLLTPFVSTFRTADNDPPVVVSQTPLPDSIQIDPRSVIRLVYNEPLRSQGVDVTLTGPSGNESGRSSLGPDLKTLVFTPDTVLAPNSAYTVTVNDVRDLAGNLALDHPLSSTFMTLDTIGPVVSELLIANDLSAVGGATVQFEARLEVNEPGARVRFTADFEPIGVAVMPPFRVPVTLPPSGSVTIRAVAADAYGNDGEVSELIVDVVPNRPPVLTLERAVPDSGPLVTGQPFSIRVAATDDAGVSEMRLRSFGALEVDQVFGSGTERTLEFILPETTEPAAPLRFEAMAVDLFDSASEPVSLVFEIVDGSSPVLAISRPSAGVTLDPLQPLQLEISVSDNSAASQVMLDLSGALTYSETSNLILAPNELLNYVFNVSLAGVPASGANLDARVTVRDEAGNETSATRRFEIRDRQKPGLVSGFPRLSEVNQSLWTRVIQFQFDEPILQDSIVVESIRFVDEFDMDVPFELEFNLVQIAGQAREIRITPTEIPLAPSSSYTLTMPPTISDPDGNRWLDADEQPVPPEGRDYVFMTADLGDIEPVQGSGFVAGQTFEAVANFEPGFGASRVRFQLGDSEPVDVSVASIQSAGVARVDLTVPDGVSQAELLIMASDRNDFSTETFEVARRALNFFARDGDEDGDGMPNEYEANQGHDFLVNDASMDPDEDNLSNLDEYLIGTNPRVADTDSDGLRDDLETPGGCPGGSDPLVPDSDGDGLLDGVDPQPCALSGGIVFVAESVVEVTEGESASVMIQAVSESAPMAFLGFIPDVAQPPFATLGRTVFENTEINGIATVELLLDPQFDEEGEYQITLRGSAADNASGDFTVTVMVIDDPSLQVTHWIDPIDGNWSDASRWSDGLPDESRIAAIDAEGTYTVTLDSNATSAGLSVDGGTGTATLAMNQNRTLVLGGPGSIRQNASLQLASGTIGGGGTLTVEGGMLWGAGTMTGTGRTVIAAGAVLETGGGGRTLSGGRELVVAGEMLMEDSGRTVLGNGTVRVSAGGVLRLRGTGEFSWNGGINAVINEGTLIREGEGAFTFSSVPLQQLGTLQWTGGDLNLNSGGVNGGSMIVPAGATLSFGTNFTHPEESELGGSGTILFQNGAHDLLGLFDPQGVVEFNNGTITVRNVIRPANDLSLSRGRLNLVADQTFASVTMTGGTIGGGGTLTVEGGMLWGAGTMTGTGRTVIAAGAVLETGGGGRTLSGGRELVVAGEMLMEDSGRTVLGNGTVRVSAGGVLRLRGTGEFSWNGGINAVINEGTLIREGEGAFTFSSVPLQQLGTLQWTGGDLNLNSGGVNGGSMIVPAGATLSFGTNFTHPEESELGGSGTILFQNGAHDLLGLFDPQGVVEFNNGTITVRNVIRPANDLSLSRGRLNLVADQTFASVTMTGGTIGGGGTLTVEGGMLWGAGTMTGTGRTVIAAGAVLETGGGGRTLSGGRELVVAGEMLMEDSGRTVLGNGTVRVSAGGVLRLRGTGEFSWNGGINAVINEGTLIREGEGAFTFSSVPLQQLGTLQWTGGDLNLNSGGVNGGSMIVPAGATLSFGTNFTHPEESELGGSGTILFQNGAHDLLGLFDPQGVVEFNNGTITVRNVIRPANDLSLSRGRLNLVADQTFASVTMTGGTIGGGGTLTVEGGMLWGAGTMTGTGRTVIAAGAVLETGGGGRTLSGGRELVVAGEMLMEDSGRTVLGNGTVRVSAGGVLRLRGTGEFSWNGGINAVINEGTLIREGEGAFTFSSVPLTSSGVLELREATLLLNSGATLGGQFSGAVGTVLEFNNNATISDGAMFASEGQVLFSSGTIEVGSALLLNQGLTVDRANVIFNVDQTFGRASLAQGSVGGSGDVTITDSVTWSTTAMRGLGRTLISEGAELEVSGVSRSISQGRELTIGGEAVWNDAGSTTLGDGTLRILPGATLTLNGDAIFQWNGGTNLFDNQGTLEKPGEGVVAFTSVPVRNAGLINLAAGEISFAGGFVSALNASLRGMGTMRFQSALSIDSNLDFGTLHVFFGNGSSIEGSFALLNQPGGTITIARNNLTVPGSMSVGGTLVLSDAAFVLSIDETLTLLSTGTIDNPGTIHVGSFVDQGGIIDGTPPEEIGLEQLRIDSIKILEADTDGLVVAAVEGGDQSLTLKLLWTGDGASMVSVEESSDLRDWRRAEATILEGEDGMFEATLRASTRSARFFRLRREE